MTTNVIEGFDNHSPEGNVNDNTTVSDNENGSAAKKVILTAGSAAKSAAGTVKDATTNAVTTVKDPEARKKAVESAKQNRTRLFAVAGAVAAIVLFRRVRKGRSNA